MTSCILTVIKNEQEYLDEWIKYHLDLGINHIFIFEDIDSDSHKEICDKYSDNVTLNSIDIVLDQNNKNIALINKSTKRNSAHIIYLKNGLSYLKNNYKYDWCFIIDIDEFITFENLNYNIQTILNLYKEYDVFTMEWKCYGANGHISKPNYDNKGIIETYTEETKGILIKEPYKTKVCFNLNKYRIEYFFNPHIPNKNICNFCNAKNIYIRHYITKSLEEYIWKKYIRGYIWGCRRNLDFFFGVNPELISYRNIFIEGINKKILVVLPYKQSGAQGKELELTLSLWKKFCTFDYHFVVIGEFDNSLKKKFLWVEFIYYKIFKKWDNQYNPHIDIINKFDIIMQKYSQIYNGFIYITDDEYAIKPFTIFDILQTYYHSSNFTGRQDQPTWYWNHDKWKTRQLLDKENLPHYNYTTHYPCYFEFDKLKEICDKFNLKNESYVFDDIYFNYFKHEEPIKDDEIRLGIWNNKIYKEEFQKALDNLNIKFCCNSVEGWSKELENSLELLLNKTNI